MKVIFGGNILKDKCKKNLLLISLVMILIYTLGLIYQIITKATRLAICFKVTFIVILILFLISLVKFDKISTIIGIIVSLIITIISMIYMDFLSVIVAIIIIIYCLKLNKK